MCRLWEILLSTALYRLYAQDVRIGLICCCEAQAMWWSGYECGTYFFFTALDYSDEISTGVVECRLLRNTTGSGQLCL